jgi:hypothetical protein
MADDDFMRIELSDEQRERALRAAARDSRAIVSEQLRISSWSYPSFQRVVTLPFGNRFGPMCASISRIPTDSSGCGHRVAGALNQSRSA